MCVRACVCVCACVCVHVCVYVYTYIHTYVYIYIYIYIVPDIGLAVRVFVNGPGDLGSVPGRVIPKTQKMVLDASLLNTQHYKVRIKGKVEQSRKGVVPSPTPWCSSYRKGSLRVTLDYGRQLYFYLYIYSKRICTHACSTIYIYIYIYIYWCLCMYEYIYIYIYSQNYPYARMQYKRFSLCFRVFVVR